MEDINQSNETPLGHPIVLFLRNISNLEKEVCLFGSYPAYLRNKDPYVIINHFHSNPKFLYEDLLWKTALQPIYIGKVTVTVIRGSIPEVMKAFNKTRIEYNGIGGNTAGTARQLSFLSPEQFQSNVFVTNFSLNTTHPITAESNIIVTMPPESEVQVNFYPFAIDIKSDQLTQQISKILHWYGQEQERVKGVMQNEILWIQEIVNGKKNDKAYKSRFGKGQPEVVTGPVPVGEAVITGPRFEKGEKFATATPAKKLVKKAKTKKAVKKK